MRDIYSTDCPKCDAAINLSLTDLDGLEDEIENDREAARQDGYDDGYQDALDERPEPQDAREADIRLTLYRAIYAGDLGKAEDAINLMAMVDIDRDSIWQAKGMERG